MTTVPEGLPSIERGGHTPGEGKACIMEYVSLIAGEQWSDSPACTHPWLAQMARSLNDNMLDRERHLLIPLVGPLMGTGVARQRVGFDRPDRAHSILAIWHERALRLAEVGGVARRDSEAHAAGALAEARFLNSDTFRLWVAPHHRAAAEERWWNQTEFACGQMMTMIYYSQDVTARVQFLQSAINEIRRWVPEEEPVHEVTPLHLSTALDVHMATITG